MIFCVVTHGGKLIRRHFWPLVGLTSVGTYHSRRKLATAPPRSRLNFRQLWSVPTEVSGLTFVSRRKLANFRENCSISVSMGPTEVLRIPVVITNDMCEAIEDFDEVEKLGQDFSWASPLEEIDIGDGSTPRPTFVNKNVSLEHKYAIIKLLRYYIDCFTCNYHKMPSLS
jgi:hypothetical protein